MDATELARWTRFAARGGIGKCTAIEDCVAERAGDLMFLKDDEITVLMQLTDHEGMYLGYCEGVVGKFKGVHVQFHSKLKKAIIAKRSSLRDGHSSKSPTPSVHSIFVPSSPVDSIHYRSSTSHSLPSQQCSAVASDDEAVPHLSHSSSSLRNDSVLNTPTSHPSPSDDPRTSNRLYFPTSEASLSSTRLPLEDKPKDSHNPLSVPEKTTSPHSGVNVSHRSDDIHALPPTAPVASLVASQSTTAAPTVSSPEPLEDDPPDIGIDDERSRRGSDALSDGEVGIGLSFLQDLANGDGNDWSSTNSRYSVDSVSRGQDKGKGTQMEDSHQSEKAKQEVQLGQRKESPTPSVLHTTLHDRRPSLAPSSSSKRSEDWEGAAADIYDNYRYSGYSVASKMSRLSTMSYPSLAPTDDAIPPVPDARPSVDAPAASEVLVEEKRSSAASDASVYTQASKQGPSPGPQGTSFLNPPKENVKGRPSPLELNKASSPLLDTTWGSPMSSPSASPMRSRLSGGIDSPIALSHLASPTTTGVASALRHRLESERHTPTLKTSSERASTAAEFGTSIVVDDDEDIPAQVVATIPFTDEPTTDEPLPSSPYDNQPSMPLSNSAITSTTMSEPTSTPTINPPTEIPSHVQNELAPPPPMTVHPTVRSHLRPSLSELRGSDEPERPSLFLPHPGAPRAPAVGSNGPMYIRSQQSSYSSDLSSADPQPRSSPQHPPGYPRTVQFIDGVPAGSSVHMARVAASSAASPPHMTAGRTVRGLTMYGRTELDLTSSTGPVLVIFSLEPPAVAHLSLQRAGLGIANPPFWSSGGTSAPPIVSRIIERPESVDQPIGAPGPAAGGGVASAIPRANFTPRAGMVRPRSRSFSGSNSASATPLEQTRKVTSHEEGSAPPDDASARIGGGRKSLGSINTQLAASSPRARGAPKSSFKPSPKSSPLRNAHAPSTLSLSENNLKAMPPKSPTTAKRPPSPLSQSSFQPPLSPAKHVHPVDIGLPARPLHGLRQATSMSVLNERKPSARQAVHNLPPPTAMLTGSGSATSPSTPTSLVSLPNQPRKPSLSANGANSNNVENTQPASPVQIRQVQNQHRSAVPSSSSSASRSSVTRDSEVAVSSEQHSSSLHHTRPSTETDTVSIQSARTRAASPSPSAYTIGRQDSLRSKLSLPNLRRARSNKHDDGDGPVGLGIGVNGEMMQVADMDFELIRPNIPAFNPAALRASEDSSMLHARDTGPSLEAGAGYLRAESPAVSMSSSGASGQRSPTVPSLVNEGSVAGANGPNASWPQLTPTSAQRSTESSVEAHRQRELKWMSILNTVTPAQAKKNKKIRKLLGEGVPASVRYRIWCLLTDGNGRFVQGVYAQLGAMGKTSQVYLDAEKDAKTWFAQHELRQSGHGGGFASNIGQSLGPQTQVLGLLQAYLAMVPDLHYSIGLVLVAGHLLLLAPEEDAFWIFVSMMDTFLRPYFAAASIQIEVDAALFAKALEANDAQVGRKVLVDLSVMPAAWCHPWFSSLFVDILPMEYLDWVWDLFLYEGVPFLIRVGLAIMICCRRQILDCPSEEALLNMLKRPSPTWLPSTPEGFINLALSFKVKDDEIRKQRVKMEAQVKRQILVPRKNSAPGSISLPRS